MAEKQAKTATTTDGVRAIELRYCPVRETEGGAIAYYLTDLRLNAPTMGVLSPETDLPMLKSDNRSLAIFQLALSQLLLAQRKFAGRELDYRWIGLSTPVHLLRQPDALSLVESILKKYGGTAKKVCLCFSGDLLREQDPHCIQQLQTLREAGLHTLLKGFGGENCPIMRLGSYPVEFLTLDSSIAAQLDISPGGDTCVRSLIAFVNALGIEPIADGVTRPQQTGQLLEMECLYYTGPHAGNYILERYVRKRNTE